MKIFLLSHTKNALWQKMKQFVNNFRIIFVKNVCKIKDYNDKITEQRFAVLSNCWLFRACWFNTNLFFPRHGVKIFLRLYNTSMKRRALISQYLESINYTLLFIC